jgi:heme exporter protein B
MAIFSSISARFRPEKKGPPPSNPVVPPELPWGMTGRRAAESWWGEAVSVLMKDLRSEFRSKSAIGSILIFAFTAMVLISFTVKTHGPGLTQIIATEQELAQGLPLIRTGHTEDRAILLSTLFWIVLYFSAMTALPRVFVKEEEMRTAPALRLAARPSAIFAGKLCFNLLLLELLTLLLLPLFVLFFQPQVAHWALLITYLLLGAAAVAGTATILGAIVARAGNRGYLMAVLGLGPLLPILVLTINGTAAAIYGSPGNILLGLVSYLVVMTVLSSLLFERVWNA